MVIEMKKVLVIMIMTLVLLFPVEKANVETVNNPGTELQKVTLVQNNYDKPEINKKTDFTIFHGEYKPNFDRNTVNRQALITRSREIKDTKDTKVRKQTSNISRQDPRKTGQIFEATAYCSCVKCCGKSDGITKSGVKVHQGTLAVDPRVIPFGTKVYIEGMGWYIAEDTGNFSGRRIDIYMESHEEALEFGRRKVKVIIP